MAFTTRETRLLCVLECHGGLVREVSLKDEEPGSVKQVCLLSANGHLRRDGTLLNGVKAETSQALGRFGDTSQ